MNADAITSPNPRWRGLMPIPNSTTSVTAMATRYAGYSLAKRDTAKSASPVVRSSVRRITNPLMTKNRSTPRCP